MAVHRIRAMLQTVILSRIRATQLHVRWTVRVHGVIGLRALLCVEEEAAIVHMQ